MTNKKVTRRALLMSVTSLLICISMLLGTTFAWFTDEVTSGVNQIVAGNLDVELYHVNSRTATEATDDDKKVTSSTMLFDSSMDATHLWEPGAMSYETFTVKNVGTLALKYKLDIVTDSNDPYNTVTRDGTKYDLTQIIKVKLLDAEAALDRNTIAADTTGWVTLGDFIANGITETAGRLKPNDNTAAGDDEKTFTLVLYWAPNDNAVDNLYNLKNGVKADDDSESLYVNLGVKLVASQDTVENDSFDNTYDSSAAWYGEADDSFASDSDATEYVITSAEQLAGLAKLVNEGNSFEGKTIKLGADIDLQNRPWTPIGTSANPFKGTFIGTGYTISNLKVNGNSGVGLFGWTYVPAHIEGVHINGANLTGNHYIGAVAGHAYLSSNCIKNCVVENATIVCEPELTGSVYDNGDKVGGIVGWAACGNITGNTVKNAVISAYRDLGGIAGYVADESTTINPEISGNTVENVTLGYTIAPGAYAGGTANQNMNDVVGRLGENVNVSNDNTVNVTKVDDEYLINTAAQLVNFGKAVNSGNTFAGKTVKLGADIDLTGIKWTPAGNLVSYPSISFRGIFDGNGHTISNLNTEDYTANYAVAGFFGSTSGDAVVKNVTFTNATVKSSHYAAVVIAYEASNLNHTSIENVVVKDSSVTSSPELIDGSYDNGDKVGGVAGYATSTNVKNCTVENTTIKAYRDFGGIFGALDGTHGSSVTDCTVNNVTLVVDNSHNYKDYKQLSKYNVNGVIGRNIGNATDTNNTATGVTIDYTTPVSSSDDMSSALSTTADSVTLEVASGNYSIPSVSNKEVTVMGSGVETVIDATGTNNYSGSDITITNCTVAGTNGGNYQGLQHIDELVYNDVTFTGKQFLYGRKVVFNNCTITGTIDDDYSFWTYGAVEVEFNNCTFTSLNNSKSILCYTEAAVGETLKRTFNNCTFNCSGTAEKSAVMINPTAYNNINTYEVSFNNCTATGYGINGISEGNGLVGIKETVKDNITVTINNNVVYSHTAA